MLWIKAAQTPLRKPIMKKALLIVPFAILAVAVGAFADTIQLREVTTNPRTPVEISVTGFTGYVYTGFYVVEIEDWGQFNALCVDPADAHKEFSPYSLIPIGETDLRYKMAAWYLNKYQDDPNSDIYTDVQLTVWSIMFDNFQVISPGYQYLPLPTDEELTAFISSASGYYLAVSPAGANPSESYGSGYQDYVLHVPEPGIVTLLGIALGAIGLFWKKIGV
jgi:hypothetical protein